jgi:hypothetical protein
MKSMSVRDPWDYKETSSILADRKRPRIWAQMRGRGGVAGSRPFSTAVQSGPNKFGDLPTYFNLREYDGTICRS